nr:four helix bundle protein [Candidatus Neomarinimicrobiota bacterium]
NISEGYSRGTGKDRARFYEYSLGSAREARDWFYKGRYILGEKIIEHRFLIITEIIKLLLTMVPDQRNYSVNEPDSEYDTLIKEAPIITTKD